MAKTFGIVTEGKGKKWRDRRVPSNDPINHCGARFDSSPLRVSKVVNYSLAYFFTKPFYFVLQTMKLVREYTGKNDDTEARNLFRTEIESVGNYFNDKSFPSNESENNAFIKCIDDASAKAYCPKRWEAMQTWIKNVRKASDK